MDMALAMAVVDSSTSPTVLLDENFIVLAASTSFYRAFKTNPAETVDKPLARIGAGEWDVPQLRTLLKATAAGVAQIDAYEMRLKAGPAAKRQLVLNVAKLNYGDAGQVRLLLSIADVTDARDAAKAKDDLLREKAILLQEVQHRVANSLQIIASVILQSARKVQSDETKLYLTDAHNRVMSIATLQRQLAASQLQDVALLGYFEQLTESIGASMIPNHKQLTLVVDVDDSVVKADVSVSLGLVVTELVINALKHAFPGRRPGRILVSYHSEGDGWILTVRDDGVGMPTGAAASASGLGTNIVAALARQLDAEVEVRDAGPGAIVSVRRAGRGSARRPVVEVG
ncbi:MAG TPA: sensor histidine kinase [Caulobacteraceae bacterium]